MNSNEINRILTGTFTDAADRRYWEERLAKVLRQEAITVETTYIRLPNGEVA